jgi:hypothetical protein
MAIDYSAEVTALFQAIQYRAPDAQDLATCVDLLSTGQATLADITADIESAPYTLTIVDAVIREYQAAFNRIPDPAGVSFWTNAVAADPGALAKLNVTFANSAEFQTIYGANATTPGQGDNPLVSALYENVLGRTPDQAGLNFWLAQNLTAAQLLQAFSQSAEFVADTAPAILVYQNLAAAGRLPTTMPLFALEPTSFTLTIGSDTVSGFTTVIGDLTPLADNGVGPTLGAGDVITNAETLNLTDEDAQAQDVIPSGAQLGAIASITLETSGNAGSASATFDTSSISGVQTLMVTSAGNGLDYVNAAVTTAIVIRQTSEGAGAGVVVTGGGSVNVVSDGGGGVFVGNPSGGGQATGGPVFVTVNGGGPVDIGGGADVTVKASGDAVTIGADNGAGGLTVVTGAVLVTDLAADAIPYDGHLNPLDQAVDVLGGINVNVTTNVGDVLIGEGGETPTSGSEPSGDVTVVNGSEGAVDIYGGANVTVTSAGGPVKIGDVYATSSQPSGDVSITVSGVETGFYYQSGVKIAGGGNVTVNTTGGGVAVGEDTDGSSAPVLGAVVINDTYGVYGPSGFFLDAYPESISVLGATTVTITTSAGNQGQISVGAIPILTADGTAIMNVADDPTGNVTIFDGSVFGAATTYGNDSFYVVTNGSMSVTITGGVGD